VRRALAVLAVVSLALAGCGSDSKTNAAGKKINDVQLLISYQQGPVFYPFSVARKLGYFADEGLSVNVQRTNGSSYVTQQLLAGKIDYGIANGPTDIIAFTKNPDIRVPVCYQNRLVYHIEVLADSPIQSVSDLKGKILGTTEVGSGEYPYAEAALHDVGLTPNTDVKFLPIGDGSAETVDALKNHKVDAYISEGLEFQLMSMNSGLQFRDITPNYFLGIAGSCFVTTKQVLEDPAKAKVFIGIARAFVKGATFGKANQQAAAAIVCADLPQTCQDQQTVAAQLTWATTEVTPVTSGVPIGGIDIAGWQEAGKVALESGKISAPVDVNVLTGGPETVAARNQILNFNTTQIQQDAQNYHS